MVISQEVRSVVSQEVRSVISQEVLSVISQELRSVISQEVRGVIHDGAVPSVRSGQRQLAGVGGGGSSTICEWHVYVITALPSLPQPSASTSTLIFHLLTYLTACNSVGRCGRRRLKRYLWIPDGHQHNVTITAAALGHPARRPPTRRPNVLASTSVPSSLTA